MVERLEQRLDELAAGFPRDPRGVPMTGAAGGLSGGLWAALGATLVPGAPYVLDAIGFDARMRESAFVVTGEGSLDEQTLQGKIVGEVATRCRQGGVTCHAIVGRDRLDPFSERILDLASVTEALSARRRTCWSRPGRGGDRALRRRRDEAGAGAPLRRVTDTAYAVGRKRRIWSSLRARSRRSLAWGRRRACRRPARARSRAR